MTVEEIKKHVQQNWKQNVGNHNCNVCGLRHEEDFCIISEIDRLTQELVAEISTRAALGEIISRGQKRAASSVHLNPIAELEAENARLREALAVYAERSNWTEYRGTLRPHCYFVRGDSLKAWEFAESALQPVKEK